MRLEKLQEIKDSIDKGVIVSKPSWLEVLDWAIELTKDHEKCKEECDPPIPDIDGWIEHTTGECPVPGYVKVDIFTTCDERDGYVQDIRRASEWNWSSSAGTGIIKYRIVEQEEN